ncbi:MAG: 30S ribosomal protein S20 [Candidatus Paceibacterota bacterium]|jgi:small subunit ribosomal protein S20
MPMTQSARKALKQNIKKRERNLAKSNHIKKLMKDLNTFLNSLEKSSKKVTAENKKEAYAKLSEVYQAVDKAVKKGVLKKNTAARKKSNLAQKINKIEKK